MRKWIIGGIIFFFIFGFLPIINCENDVEVREKVCKLYGTCEVDVYYPMSLALTGCPDREICPFWLAAVGILMIGFSVGSGIGIDYLYRKYRDF